MSAVRLNHENGLTQVSLRSPILSVDVLCALDEALAEAARSFPDEPLVLTTEHPRIFLAGADLGEIERLDPETSDPYARLGRKVLARLTCHPSPTVAAVHGPCTGGGFDLVLRCDAVTAAPRASFGHPGVRRGLVTGWGGTRLVPARLGHGISTSTLVEGRVWSAHEAFEMGLVCAVADDVVRTARAEAQRLATLHPTRLETWRSLLSQGFVDTFRTFVVHNRRQPVSSSHPPAVESTHAPRASVGQCAEGGVARVANELEGFRSGATALNSSGCPGDVEGT